MLETLKKGLDGKLKENLLAKLRSPEAGETLAEKMEWLAGQLQEVNDLADKMNKWMDDAYAHYEKQEAPIKATKAHVGRTKSPIKDVEKHWGDVQNDIKKNR